MKIELFVLPAVMRRDFMDAFVLSKEDFEMLHPAWREELETLGGDFDEWYEEAYLWEKMSPDLPVVGFEAALALLRSRIYTIIVNRPWIIKVVVIVGFFFRNCENRYATESHRKYSH